MKKQNGWIVYLLIGLAAIIIITGAIIYYLSISAKIETNNAAAQSTPTRFFAYQIQLGMTQKQVEDLWGPPDDRDTYKSDYGYYVTYTYVDDYKRYIIIDFENGVVASVGEY